MLKYFTIFTATFMMATSTFACGSLFNNLELEKPYPTCTTTRITDDYSRTSCY